MHRIARTLVVLAAFFMLPLAATKAYAGPITEFEIHWSSSTYGSGSGLFTATSEGGGEFLLTQILGGSKNGSTIQLLGVGDYSGNDNLLFPTFTAMLDNGGFSFVNQGNVDFNIYYNNQGNPYLECDSTGGTCYIGNGTVLSTFTVTQLPEPSSILALFSGLMILAVVQRKRLV